MALSELQRRKLTSLFHWYDHDNNGYLEVDDFKKIVNNLQQIRGWRPNSHEYNDVNMQFMFAWSSLQTFADKSRDNLISLEEWLAYMDMVLSSDGGLERTVDSMASMLTDLADVDEDGRITPEEYRLFLMAYDIDQSLLGEIFSKLDTNADGYLSRDEVSKLVTEFYTSNNPNSPGNWMIGPF